MGVDAVPALFRVSGGGQHKYAMRCLTLTCTPMKRGVLFFSESGTANPKCGKLAVFHCPPVSHLTKQDQYAPTRKSLPKAVTSAQLNVGFEFFFHPFRNRIGGVLSEEGLV